MLLDCDENDEDSIVHKGDRSCYKYSFNHRTYLPLLRDVSRQ